MASPKSNPTQTVLVITVGFLILYLVFKHNAFLIISLSIGSIGILSTFLSQKIEWVWFKLTHILSLIVPNILLGLIFYLFLTPIAFFANLSGKKDTLQIKKPGDTAFVTVNKKYKPEDLEKPW
ncbi:hypothetical protein [Algoriphagus pacificus]|uniref:Uncharacterized protein n=1 Tax=Algoriphagus pacificus TaxID=2811234 RepID=A0ABS3CKC1_9BACT|nr:hypothetical protein [Algoriphagus pacificus]MBN7817553.1 hypothetical protein [Algoriphagus pacificus]